MNTIKNNCEENPDDHKKGWLNLTLAPSLGKSCSNSKPTASTKVYTCSFCKRKFYSSQALGGHQNAHRRERDAVRRHYSSNSTMNAFNQSLMLHSLVQKPRRNAEKTVAKFTENGAQYGVAWEQAPSAWEEEANMKWPGSFYLYPQPDSPQADPCWLDLNLKL